MTQFVPYVEGTREDRRRNAAALALLKTSPAGSVVVVQEVPRVDAGTQRNLAARATTLAKSQAAVEANARFHTVQDHERGVVRLLGTKSGTGDAPTFEDVSPVKTPRVPADAPKVTLSTAYVTTVPKKTRSRSTKQDRDAGALTRALNANGKVVSVATYPFLPGAKATVEDQRRKAERRRDGLKRAAKAAGVKVVVRVRTTTKGVNVSAHIA